MKSLQKLLKNNKDMGHQYIDFMQLFEKKLKQCIINHNSRKTILAQYKQQQYIHSPMPFFETEHLTVYGSFENSNIHGCSQEEGDVLNVLLSSDTNTQGCTQWFYFGVKMHHEGKLKIRILNNRRQNTLFKDCNHIYVYDNEKWSVGQAKEMYYYRTNINHPYYHHEDASIALLQQNFALFTLEFTFEFKQCDKIVFFALTRPYPIKKLQNFLEQCPLQRKSVCITTLGLPVWQLKTPKQEGQQTVVILARQHPSETAGSFICQELLQLLSQGHPCMNKYRFIIYPMVNPDGVFLGNSRCNFNGVDLNRKWDTPKQKTEPEVHYILKSLSKYSNIAFMIDLHGHSKKFNQFLYGCLQGKTVAEYMKTRQFGKLLGQNCNIFTFKRDCSYGVSPDRAGTARVALWKKFNIANSVTIETSIYGQQGKAFSLEDYHTLAANILHALNFFDDQIDSPELNINREMSKALRYDSGSDSEAEADLIAQRPNRIKITSRKESSCKHQSVGYGYIKPKIETPQLIHQHSQFFKDQSFVELNQQPKLLTHSATPKNTISNELLLKSVYRRVTTKIWNYDIGSLSEIIIQMKLILNILVTLALCSNDAIQDNVNRIKNLINEGANKHEAYENLAYIVDTFGPRMWAQKSMGLAVTHLHNYIANWEATKQGLVEVKLEKLDDLETWVRGDESLTLKSPRKREQKLGMIGLGLGVAGDIEAEVVVVQNWDQLDTKGKAGQLKDKIVCYNVPWTSYDDLKLYRQKGADRASVYNAKAVLLRSVASFSIYSPHTGNLRYAGGDIKKIPAAAITAEDAEMFQRMQEREQRIVVHLILNNSMQVATSHNIIAEIKGSEYPDQIILMGGHFDSWDTGSQTGAMDDGAGTLVTLEALKTVADLKIRPKRTLRWIAWSGEEMGLPNNGAQHYVKNHGDEDHVVALENDVGQLQAIGFGFSGKLQTSRMVRLLIMKYIPELSVVQENDGSGVDSKPLGDKGVPLMRNIYNDPNDNYYFKYHHSAGDSMNILNADDMDSNVFAISSMMYIIADYPERLPK